jgi:hypothetical protein
MILFLIVPTFGSRSPSLIILINLEIGILVYTLFGPNKAKWISGLIWIYERPISSLPCQCIQWLRDMPTDRLYGDRCPCRVHIDAMYLFYDYCEYKLLVRKEEQRRHRI